MKGISIIYTVFLSAVLLLSNVSIVKAGEAEETIDTACTSLLDIQEYTADPGVWAKDSSRKLFLKVAQESYNRCHDIQLSDYARTALNFSHLKYIVAHIPVMKEKTESDMTDQQLLLVVLGTIEVGIAVVEGIQEFNPSQQHETECSDKIDNDGDGQTDCYDSDCANDVACAHGEICNNAIDDDNDMAVDCRDPDCFNDPFCN